MTKSKNKQPKSIDEGRSQSGLRAFNEKLILALIRQQGSISKADIANNTTLSAQAVTVIMKKLEADHLVKKLAPVRGKVGQPSTPFALNADGAFGLGLNIERKGVDLTLIDFTGNVRGTLHETYDYPTIDNVLRFVERGCAILTQSLEEEKAKRIAGIGIAAPFELWRWSDEINAPLEELQRWQDFDIEQEISKLCGLKAFACNDDSAACAAELCFGNRQNYKDFLYLFIGTFIGGGVVLNHCLQIGSRGNAAAIGSMPITIVKDDKITQEQLINTASIYTLEKLLNSKGLNSDILRDSADHWGVLGPILDEWIETVSTSLTTAALCGMAIFDFEALIIEGRIPTAVKTAICKKISEKLKEADLRGLSPVEVIRGTIGSRAQSIGSAGLPLIATFSPDNGSTFRGSL